MIFWPLGLAKHNNSVLAIPVQSPACSCRRGLHMRRMKHCNHLGEPRPPWPLLDLTRYARQGFAEQAHWCIDSERRASTAHFRSRELGSCELRKEVITFHSSPRSCLRERRPTGVNRALLSSPHAPCFFSSTDTSPLGACSTPSTTSQSKIVFGPDALLVLPVRQPPSGTRNAADL